MSARVVCVAALVASFVGTAVDAQYRVRVRQRQHTSDDYRPFGAAFFQIGGMRGEYDELSDELIAAGFEAPRRNSITLGGGGYRLYRNFLVGGEGHAVLSQSQSTTTGRQTGLNAGYGMLNIGYAMLRTERWIIYPLGGVGGGALQVDLRDRNGTGLGPDVNDPTWEEVMADPGHRSRLNRVGLVTSVGMGIDFVARSPRSGSTGGFLVGVRAGYLFNPASGNWRLYDEEVTGGPEARLAGPFFKVSFGGGGTRNR
jgi:opacity protein-like surface antigen